MVSIHTHTYKCREEKALSQRSILKAHFLDGPQLLPLAAMSQRKAAHASRKAGGLVASKKTIPEDQHGSSPESSLYDGGPV